MFLTNNLTLLIWFHVNKIFAYSLFLLCRNYFVEAKLSKIIIFLSISNFVIKIFFKDRLNRKFMYYFLSFVNYDLVF